MEAKKLRIAIVTVVLCLCLPIVLYLWHILGRPVREQILLQACGNGSIPAVTHLLNTGVSPDARDGWNTSCMFMAAGNGHIEVVELLLDNGVKIDEPYRMNKTALIVASQAGHLETVKFLISRDADMSLRDTDGKSARDHALEQQHFYIADFLGK